MEKARYDKIYTRVLESMKKDYLENQKYNFKEGMSVLRELAKEWKSYKENPGQLSEENFQDKFALYSF